MNKLNRLMRKVEQIEKLLAEIKLELKELGEQNKKKKHNSLKKKAQPHDKELREEYEMLYKCYIRGEIEKISEFVRSRSKEYLKHFCRANNLPIDTKKKSKDEIFREIANWMGQKKAISEEIKPVKF